ncbi:MAG: superoxide dismutase [Fe] [Deltaproteobacteria bacterium]|nr:superoxide dismutase [Fe] [Deltaproteobacteria bacterium]
MSITLSELPYAIDALAPHISKETLEFHYGKHHQAYVTNLNNLIEGSPMAALSLEEIILKADGAIFNNAAQIWNHTFYWHSLSPSGGNNPHGAIAEAISRDFGSFGKFKEEFTKACATLFGSGWAFLTQNADGKLQIRQEPNAGCPLISKLNPVLTCDVWEHAYYIDYRNARPKYIDAFWNLVNWDFANKNLKP